jgi:hypothetical protein
LQEAQEKITQLELDTNLQEQKTAAGVAEAQTHFALRAKMDFFSSLRSGVEVVGRGSEASHVTVVGLGKA